MIDTSKDAHLLGMPGASDDYLEARERLRVAERALIDHAETVAALRRTLPPGPIVDDYEFEEMDGTSVRLSQLFADDKAELVVYHLMYWADDDEFCPMCTLWLDGWDGVADHIQQRVPLVVASRAPAATLRAWAEKRGWRRLRLVSDRDERFAKDTGAEDAEGRPDSTILVFTKEHGDIRHVYTGHPFMDGKQRNLDLLSPVWHLFDLLPSGRGEWYPTTDYT